MSDSSFEYRIPFGKKEIVADFSGGTGSDDPGQAAQGRGESQGDDSEGMGEAAHELPIPESMGDHPHEADSGMHLRRIGEQEPKSGPPGREQHACSVCLTTQREPTLIIQKRTTWV